MLLGLRLLACTAAVQAQDLVVFEKMLSKPAVIGAVSAAVMYYCWIGCLAASR